ncbi:MAG: hypothetical protein ACKO72_00925 [Actinomycetes bacterium]
MSVPPPVAAETCILCGTALDGGAERCPGCDLWVGVDGPGVRRPLPQRLLLGLGLGIAAIWVVTFAVAAAVG